jgi:hypothetical protein
MTGVAIMQFAVGDYVLIQESRPISKRKRYTVVEIKRPADKVVDQATGQVYTKYD